MLKLSTGLELLINRNFFSVTKKNSLIFPCEQLSSKSLFNKSILISAEQQMQKRNRRIRSASDRKKNNGSNQNDQNNNNRGGGLLQPIIEDWKQWIQKRKPQQKIYA